MSMKAVIFDLDGTLLDTLEDIAISVNHVLREYKKEPIELDKFRYLVGKGALQLIKDVLPDENQENVEKALGLFEKVYAKQYDKNTKLYKGIGKLLTFLKKRGYKLAILSNKPDSFTKLCAVKYLRKWDFEVVFGIRENVPKKPEPNGVYDILKILQVDAKESLYVGDTDIDMITAKRANIKNSIGVLWGFRDEEELRKNGARYIASSPEKMIRLLQRISVD